MSGAGAYAGAGAAAAAAAVANAIKASGAIVRVESAEFVKILSKMDKPVVIIARGGWLSKGYKYLTAYKGFIFFAKSKESLHLPGDAELIASRQIWIPS